MITIEKHIFGKVTLCQIKCPDCGEKTLCNENELECSCGGIIDKPEISNMKMISSNERKQNWKKSFKNNLIKVQNGKCFWCDREFGSFISYKGKPRKLYIRVDHMVPFSFTKTHDESNLVASCSICNGFKHSKIFRTIEDCREFILNTWDCYIQNNTIKEY